MTGHIGRAGAWLPLAGLLAVVGAGSGCILDFDGIRDRAWSDSNRRPDGVRSGDYGAVVGSVATEQAGATVIALGVEPLGLGLHRYDLDGALDEAGLELAGTPIDRPEVVGSQDPVGEGDGIIAVGGVGEIQIYSIDNAGGLPTLQRTIENDECGIVLPMRDLGTRMAIGLTNAGDPAEPDLIAVAGPELVVIPDVALGGAGGCFKCSMTEQVTMSDFLFRQILDVVLVDLGAPDGLEVVVSLDNGTLIASPAQFFIDANDDNCLLPATPQLSNLSGPGGEPDFGAVLAVGDANDDGTADLVASAPSQGRVYTFLLENSGPGNFAQLTPPAGAVNFGAASVFADLDGDGSDELIVGDPGAGTASAPASGMAYVYSFDSEDGYVRTAELTDSSPEPNQAFARSLAVAEFAGAVDDTDLLIVGASGEVFTYFRALLRGIDPRVRP